MKKLIWENMNLIGDFVKKNKRFLYLFDNDYNEMVSELIMVALDRIDRFDSERGRLSTYLYFVLTNYCRDKARDRKEDCLELYDNLSTDYDLVKELKIYELESIVYENAPLTFYHFFRDYNYDELSKKEGVSKGTISKRISKEREVLRDILEEMGYNNDIT